MFRLFPNWFLCYFLLVSGQLFGARDLLSFQSDEIGYFWHITDIHFDHTYNIKSVSTNDASAAAVDYDSAAVDRTDDNDNEGDGDDDYSDYNDGGTAAAAAAATAAVATKNQLSNEKCNKKPNLNPLRTIILSSNHNESGNFFNYECDTPLQLIESLAKFLYTQNINDIEFVLWTGDSLSKLTRNVTASVRRDYYRLLTRNFFQRLFSTQFVLPVIGYEDSFDDDFDFLYETWKRWLPPDSTETFKKGGYYLFERKSTKLQIVVLNTNFFLKINDHSEAISKKANEQWNWLESILTKLALMKQTVYLVGHTPPGLNERDEYMVRSKMIFAYRHNRRYLELVRRFHDIIVGQFFGHLHSDTFRVIYDTNYDRAISWLMVAPSVTPMFREDIHNNPGIRYYKIAKYSGNVLDYRQFFLPLQKNQTIGGNQWQLEYDFSSYYKLTGGVNAKNLNKILSQFSAEDFRNVNRSTFAKYFVVNSVKAYRNLKRAHCHEECLLKHFCAIRHIDYSAFTDCANDDIFFKKSLSSKSAVKSPPLFAPPAATLCVFSLFLVLLSFF